MSRTLERAERGPENPLAFSSLEAQRIRAVAYSVDPCAQLSPMADGGIRITFPNNGHLGPAQAPPAIIGSVYFLQTAETKRIKIGFSTNVQSRIDGIGTSCPEDTVLLGVIDGVTEQDERALHAKFRASHVRREWFHPHDDLLAYIKDNAK